ncbi:LOW QUALITY PROTEIN: hypothetical protein V1477_014844 [Vespula maculifrons]|uniref:Uncharacterized protein n=1 Tax=Vespula maculifrons TaxID=7453 RepID=A0ABD2BJP4_VESMC
MDKRKKKERKRKTKSDSVHVVARRYTQRMYFPFNDYSSLYNLLTFGTNRTRDSLKKIKVSSTVSYLLSFSISIRAYLTAIGHTENFLLDFQSAKLKIFTFIFSSFVRLYVGVDLDQNDKRDTRYSRLTKSETLSRNGRPVIKKNKKKYQEGKRTPFARLHLYTYTYTQTDTPANESLLRFLVINRT